MAGTAGDTSYFTSPSAQVLTPGESEKLVLRAVDPKSGLAGGVAFAVLLIAGNSVVVVFAMVLLSFAIKPIAKRLGLRHL